MPLSLACCTAGVWETSSLEDWAGPDGFCTRSKWYLLQSPLPRALFVGAAFPAAPVWLVIPLLAILKAVPVPGGTIRRSRKTEVKSTVFLRHLQAPVLAAASSGGQADVGASGGSSTALLVQCSSLEMSVGAGRPARRALHGNRSVPSGTGTALRVVYGRSSGPCGPLLDGAIASILLRLGVPPAARAAARPFAQGASAGMSVRSGTIPHFHSDPAC